MPITPKAYKSKYIKEPGCELNVRRNELRIHCGSESESVMIVPIMSPDVENAHFPIDVAKTSEGSLASSIPPRLDALTSLRIFAALHVVLFHMRVTGILAGGPWVYQNFAGIGYIGVNFFFVLSGFILVYTYAGHSLNPRQFWQARFARIYPAYVLSLVISAPFFFVAVRHLNLPFFSWSKNHLLLACILTVCLLQSWVPQAALTWNSVSWSLSVEAFFYSVFPSLAAYIKRLSPRKVALAGAGFSFLSLAFSFFFCCFIRMASTRSTLKRRTCSGRICLALIPCYALRNSWWASAPEHYS
ncbi:MAG: acyltransferase [Acidobacteria bacterium]|nr:acyltransferase [Acidobacteriota bacterium]